MPASHCAFGIEFLDTTIKSQQQIDEWLSVAFLGIVPRMQRAKEGMKQELLVHAQPRSAIAECFRSIRTNLLFMSPEKPLRTILITSSSPEDGKTTTALNLAAVMAENGSRVLLVDADMRRPKVHRALNIPNTSGLSSLILGEGNLESAIRHTDASNLWVLTCGPVPPNPAELLHTESFTTLLELMCQKFDRIIIDSPPVGAVSDAVVISTKVDGSVIVLKAGKTSRDMAQRTERTLRDVNARILGAVLNDLDLENRGYASYYYSRHGYYQAEGSEGAASS